MAAAVETETILQPGGLAPRDVAAAGDAMAVSPVKHVSDSLRGAVVAR